MNIAMPIVIICATETDIEKPNVIFTIIRLSTAGLAAEKPIVLEYASQESAGIALQRFARSEPANIPASR